MNGPEIATVLFATMVTIIVIVKVGAEVLDWLERKEASK